MCFMVKCPYVPPHEWDLDFPHLMLRYRSVEHHKGMTSFADKELDKTDRNGKLGTLLDAVANIATKSGGPMRGALQSVKGIHKRAHLPIFADVRLPRKAAHSIPDHNPEGWGLVERKSVGKR